jgi:hypothetical protein
LALVEGQRVRRHLLVQLEFSLAFAVSAVSTFALSWIVGQSLAPGYALLPNGLLPVVVLCPMIVLEAADSIGGPPPAL